MDKKCDSLLKRRKMLEAIKDSQQRSLKRKRKKIPTLKIRRPDQLNTNSEGDIKNTEIKLNKRKRTVSIISNSSNDDTSPICKPKDPSNSNATSASNKEIKIISVLYKPKGCATFSKKKPSSTVCLPLPSSLMLVQPPLDISTTDSTISQPMSSFCVQYDSGNTRDCSTPFPASITPQASSSLCVSHDDDADTHLSASLPASTTPQANSALCASHDDADTYLTAPLPASTTPQPNSSLCVSHDADADTHLTAPLPSSATLQASSSLCVSHNDDADTYLIAPLPASTNPQASSSLRVSHDDDNDTHFTTPLLVSTTPQASSSLCESHDNDGDTHSHRADNKLLQQDVPMNSDDEGCKRPRKKTGDIPTKKQKRRKVVKKAFIDFLSEDDENPFSAGSSDNWTVNESDESSDSDSMKKKKKCSKKKKPMENNEEREKIKDMEYKKAKPVNKYKLNKKLRDAGQPFKNRKGESNEGKTVQENPCFPGKCNRKCYEITEERRLSLHTFFWSLDVQRRKDWIVRCSRAVPVDRKRTDSPCSRRNITYEYYVNDGEDHKQVCQKFLLRTLDIKQKYLLHTISHSREGMAQIEQRKRTAASKYSESAKQYVTEFIDKLPAVPSHYSRKDINRVYLSQELKNISNLYQIYKNDCQEKDKEVVSEKIFREIFNEKYSHVSFHIPKKDKCVHCTKAENQDLKEDEQNKMQLHIVEKKASYKRFHAHQNINTIDNKTVTASFDLQKVLNTPHGESMLLYYSRKYAVYNFTVYESGTQEGYCFTWGECDGKRGSNEIASCLFEYLKILDDRGVQNLLLYCDSCSGQNKNKTVLSALNYYLIISKNLQVIQINYLLPGHTYMPADSMHATIEREVKKLIVWSPSQWATYFETARKRPKPYSVTVMDHCDFLDWEEVTSYTFTKETLKYIKWRELRIATFKKKNLNQVEIKNTMTENAETHTIQLFELKAKRKGKGKGKGKGKSKSESIQHATEDEDRYRKVTELNLLPLYKKKLPIPTAKYNDLKRLCENGTIPKRFHTDYIQLPFQSQVVETLLDTDEEDETDEIF